MTEKLESIVLQPDGTPNATVVWLHGLGADGSDFVPIVPELDLPDGHGVRFIFPHAPIRPITLNGGMKMRGWYDISDDGLRRQTDEAGIKQSAAAIAKLIDGEIESGIAPNRIILAGFSQGGAIAYHLGLRYPQTLGGIMALSTYIPMPDTLQNEMTAGNERLPVFIAHGLHDPLVQEALGKEAADMLAALNLAVEYHSYAMDHAVCLEEIKDISKWLKARLPY